MNYSITATDKDLVNVGKQLTRGAFQYLGWLCCLLLVASILLNWLSERDATDSASKRSGVALRIDYGTGCQYLEGKRGGLTPRLGTDGKQVCQ